MTRREKNRLLQEENERRMQQEEADKKTRRRVTGILFAACILAGIGMGVLLLAFTAYGALTAENVLLMALYPALAAAVLFTLLYGISYGVLHKVPATRPQKKKLARISTAAAIASALLTMVVCILFDLI